jgi:hypothetical protein
LLRGSSFFQNLVRVPFSARIFKKSGIGRGYHR